MPKLHDWFHYRNLDVSTVKNLARLWYPEQVWSAEAWHAERVKSHRVIGDLNDSIAELSHYRANIFASRRDG